MYLNITTQRITKYPQDGQGRVVSQDDLAANKIYPLAANQPIQQAFQVEVWTMPQPNYS